ncbi:MAG: peptidoglycan-associated lipoprotein Pal [Nitrospiraceae bacterium]
MTGYEIHRILLWILIVAAPVLVTGCSGRKVGTSVQDQTVVAGHPKPTERAKAGSGGTVEPHGSQPPVPSQAAAPSAPPVLREAPGSVQEEKPAEATIDDDLRPGVPDAATAEPQFSVKEEAETVVTPEPDLAPSIELADVYFDFDEFSIRSDGKIILEANAQLLAAHADGTVIIEGHCDERGSADYNLVLGERRAQAVKRYLQKRGVPSSRIQVMTYGKERPFCMERTDECYQKNRRAHFEFRQ